LPGEMTLIISSMIASRGKLNIVKVLCIAFAAAVIGDSIGYWIGRLGGRAIILRYGKYIFLSESRFQKVEQLFSRYSQRIVFAARFIAGLRQLNGLVAGTLAMPWKRFVLFNAMGAALWVAFWGILSYFLGHHAHNIYLFFYRFEIISFGILVIMIVLFLLLRKLKK
jgi:membrane protein DedA with SNARE-associated domain